MSKTNSLMRSLKAMWNPERKSATWSIPWYAGADRLSIGSILPQSTVGYNNNTVVHGCVRLIATAAAATPWIGYSGDDEVADDHPVLRLLSRPSPGLSRTAMMEAVYSHLLLSGEAYLLHSGDNPRSMSLHVLHPNRMRIEVGEDGWPSAYVYRSRHTAISYPVDPVDGSRVLHIRLFSPLDDHHGVAPLSVASSAIAIHDAASRWNHSLLHNSARPSGAMVYRDSQSGVMGAEQFERLKQELAEVYQGAANAGRPLLLEGGLEWKQMSLSPTDMDFVAVKNMAAREIALAFGVPPMLLGLPGDNTYANYAEANRSLWRQTLLPLIEKGAAEIGSWLQRWAPEDDFRIGYDIDRIEALSAERERRWNRIGRADFLSDDEKRVALGYSPRNG